MHRGHLFARTVRMPFCTESSSEGSPSLAHFVTSTSSASSVSSLHAAKHL